MADNKEIFVEMLQNDPLFFVHDVLGCRTWSKQRTVIKSVNNTPRTTARGCHGWGKTFVAAAVALQFLYTNSPAIVITTAPTFRQVEKLIWKEIRTNYKSAKLPLGGKLQEGQPLLQVVKDQWYMIGFATQDGDRFQGFHEENILVIVDEAAGVTETIFTAIEGVLTSSNSHLLLIGNPTSVAGYFKKSFEEQGWSKIAVSAFDTPNFKYHNITREDIAKGTWEAKMELKGFKLPFPKMVTPAWVADKYKRWGTSSPLWTTRIEGNFDEEGSDSLIPLAWIEAAKERWHELSDDVPTELIELGVDVAEFGRDSSNVYIKKGQKILPAKTFSKIKIMTLVGHIILIYSVSNASLIKVDTIGVGTGVEGRLEEQGYPTVRVNVGEAPGGNNDVEKSKFINKRAQLYWALREALDPDTNRNPYPLGLPEDDELEEELMATKYKINSKGQIQIIAKDDIKAKIGRSPDKADALMLANAPAKLLEKQNKILSAGSW